MKKTTLLFSFLAIALGIFAQKDWARFNRYEAQNASVEMPVKVVFMGNSITEGWYRQDSAFFLNNRFAGRGISGQTSSEMLVRFRRDVIDLKPKAVVILAGTNDIAQNNGPISLQNVMGNIESMCQLAKANKIKVVLCSVLPAYEFPWRKELKPAGEVKKLNEMIRAYADKNKIPYVDYYNALADERGGLPKKYASDGIHPNMEAYKIMEGLVMKPLRKIAQ
ncbi:MAG: SGNH/GDSL hydrolase family protein [Bacteroidales bacterium]